MVCSMLGIPVVYFKDEEECNHKGCRAHLTHPCEVCGRIAAKGSVVINRLLYDSLLINQKKT